MLIARVEGCVAGCVEGCVEGGRGKGVPNTDSGGVLRGVLRGGGVRAYLIRTAGVGQRKVCLEIRQSTTCYEGVLRGEDGVGGLGERAE